MAWSRVAIVHENTRYGLDYASALSTECRRSLIQCEDETFESGDAAEMRAALEHLNNRNFRVFFVVVGSDDLARLAELAADLRMVGPDFCYIFSDSASSAALQGLAVTPGRAMAVGAYKVHATGINPHNARHRAFVEVFEKQREANYNRSLAAADPFASIDVGFFARGVSSDVSEYAYDAVAAIGLAACRNSSDLVATLRTNDFEGASGRVEIDNETGSRLASSAYFVLGNVRLAANGTLALRSIASRADGANWTLFPNETYVFASGNATPPDDLGSNAGCQPGHYLEVRDDDSGYMQCRQCAPGKYQPATGATTCIDCDDRSYAEAWGSKACTSCPENSHTVGGQAASTSVSLCVCEAGSYSRTWPLTSSGCVSCHGQVHALECDGGLTQPYPRGAYWLDGNELVVKAAAYRCRYAFLCKGGDRPASCASTFDDALWNATPNAFIESVAHLNGATNASDLRAALVGGNDRRKRVCVDGHGRIEALGKSKRWCLKGHDATSPLCEDVIAGRRFGLATLSVRSPSGIPKGVFTALVWISIFFLFMIIIDVVRPTYEVLDVVLTSYQDLGIITSFRLYWPKQLSKVFIAYYIALFDIDVFSPNASFPKWSHTEAFYLMLSMPFVYACMRTVWFLVATPRTPQAWRQTVGSTLSFMLGSTPSLLTYSLSAFTCRHFVGISHVVRVESPSKMCDTNDGRIMAVVAGFYVAIVIVGAAAFVWLRLADYSRRNMLCEPKVLDVFGSTYLPFKTNALWWGSVRLTRQVLLVVIANAFWKSPFTQALLAIGVLLVMATWQSRVAPFLSQVHNAFELLGICVAVMSIVLGVAFTALETEPSLFQPKERVFLLSVFLALQAAYLLFAFKETIKDALQVSCRHTAVHLLCAAGIRVRRGWLEQHPIPTPSPNTVWPADAKVESAQSVMMSQATTVRRLRSFSFGTISDLVHRIRGEESPNERQDDRDEEKGAGTDEDGKNPTVPTDVALSTADIGSMEVLKTFKGYPLYTHVASQAFNDDEVRELADLVALDRAISPFVADHSKTNNYSSSPEADFYRHLDQSFPFLIDTLMKADDAQRKLLAQSINVIFKHSYEFHLTNYLASSVVVDIDRSSVVFFLAHCSRRDRARFTKFVDKLVERNPSHRSHQLRANAIILAYKLQRLWRAKRGGKSRGDASCWFVRIQG